MVGRLAALKDACIALGRGYGSTRKGHRGDEEGEEGRDKESEGGEHSSGSNECNIGSKAERDGEESLLGPPT